MEEEVERDDAKRFVIDFSFNTYYLLNFFDCFCAIVLYQEIEKFEREKETRSVQYSDKWAELNGVVGQS